MLDGATLTPIWVTTMDSSSGALPECVSVSPDGSVVAVAGTVASSTPSLTVGNLTVPAVPQSSSGGFFVAKLNS
jgi:hypothetical protein